MGEGAQTTPIDSEMLQQLGMAIDQVLWVVDHVPHTRVVWVSAAFETLFGFTAQALQQDINLWLNCVLPEDRERARGVRQRVEAADPSGLTTDIEYRIRRVDGAVRHLAVRSRQWFDAQGQHVRTTGISRDITERKAIEAEAQRSFEALQATAARLASERNRLQELAEAVPNALHTFRMDPQGRVRITFGVEHMAAIYGVSAERLREDGRVLYERIHPEDRARVGAAVEASKQTATPWHCEYRVNHPERGLRWVEGRSRPLADPDGSVSWHGALTDITERRTQQAEIERLNGELEARVVQRTTALQDAVKELEAFTYTVSHDLRAPLRAIDGFSQAVQDDFSGLLPEEGQRYLRIIRDSAGRMAQLIDDLLSFSRVGRAPLNRHAVDMNQLLRECRLLLSPQCEGRDIEWQVSDLPPTHGDQALLRQVWINLLSNAIKYSRGRTPAVITIDSFDGLDGQPQYRVQDNGAGFNMKYAHKLFGVFERLHRADEFEGTGVGLAIVQRIIQRHGGTIQADSQPGLGATFTFALGR